MGCTFPWAQAARMGCNHRITPEERIGNNWTMVLDLASGRVVGEDKVASFDRLVARKAGFEQRFVRRFAVFELSKSPATRRSVFSGVLHHELNVRGGTGHERLGTAKDFVVFLRRNV